MRRGRYKFGVLRPVLELLYHGVMYALKTNENIRFVDKRWTDGVSQAKFENKNLVLSNELIKVKLPP